MYVLIFLVLIYVGGRWIARGVTHADPTRFWLGTSVIALDLLFFGLMSFWGEMLWYRNLGYESRFWTLVYAEVGAVVLGAVTAAALGFVLALRSGVHLRRLVMLAAAAGGVIWGIGGAEPLLLFLNATRTDVVEPVINMDTGFYLFYLPFFDRTFWLLLYTAVVALVAALFVWESGNEIRLRHFDEVQGNPVVLPMANAGLAWVLAGGMVLNLFHLLYSDWGVVQGAGWVDVSVLFPAFIVAAAGFFFVGFLPLFPAFRRFMTMQLSRWLRIGRPAIAAMATVWTAIAALAIVVLLLIPGLIQWLIVKPNEITFEEGYIAHNIAFTRRGFGLHEVEERAFTPANEFTREMAEDNRHLISEIRLWDWQALDAVYKQFQEIRLYYEFVDVDIDRYQLGDRYRQVMVSARELGQHNLAPQSQTFVNQRFKYTHGYGYTAAAVSDFTEQGLPNLLVKDIPPVTQIPELAVNRPEIYYGELTVEPAVVNTLEEEFDYPSGDKNIYTRYQGQGGIAMSSFWRRLLLSWKLDGTVLLFSSYPTAESRVMFDREISGRVEKLAPFLTFDEDPYIVARDGKLYWIIDGYTRSNYYPYSQPFDSGSEGDRTVHRLHGANYVRNSVKAVVDAYNGSVDFYVFDAEDPIIGTWARVFPDLFKPEAEMPEGLRKHVRYPHDFLLAQGLIYSKYHMSNPEVFYNQEDLWVRATERHYSDVVPVAPYYVMWELPGSDQAEFVLILPFTPKNKQVLIGWIAGLSDGDNYGRFLAYNFPKEERMLGPQQVETKIDQDSFLSGQLTLWNQQGSEVIRGNVLAIPVDDALLYVEPIYLQAKTAAYPELRLVAVMYGDNLSYGQSFDEALTGLFRKSGQAGTRSTDLRGMAQEAKAAFNAYLQAQGNREFDRAAQRLQELSELLSDMTMEPEARP